MKSQIALTNWSETPETSKYVNSPISNLLKSHHLHILRFLYKSFTSANKLKGALINCDKDMSSSLSIAALLSSITTLPYPILIFTTRSNLNYWEHFLNLIPQANLEKADSLNFESESKTKCSDNFKIVLTTSKETIKKNYKYSFVIVDEIDQLINTVGVKSLQGDFNIAITSHNFYKDIDDKLLWSILKWTNSAIVGNFKKFTEYFEESLNNVIQPFDSIWLSISWDFCETFKKEDEDELERMIKLKRTNESPRKSDEQNKNRSNKRAKVEKKESSGSNLKKAPAKNKSAKVVQEFSNKNRNNKLINIQINCPNSKNIKIINDQESTNKIVNDQESTNKNIKDNISEKNLENVNKTNTNCSLENTDKMSNKTINIISKTMNIINKNITNEHEHEKTNINDNNISTDIEDIESTCKTPEKNKIETLQHFSSSDDENSVLHFIISSPVKNLQVVASETTLEDYSQDSSFDDSDILTKLCTSQKKDDLENSIIESIIDGKINEINKSTGSEGIKSYPASYLENTDSEEEESVLSSLF